MSVRLAPMNINTLWIVSDDNSLQRELQATLSCDVARLGYCVAVAPESVPQVIVVDLRDGARWGQLAALRKMFDHLLDVAVPMIALLDSELPLAWAHLADITFAACIDWPCQKDKLIGELRRAVGDKRPKPSQRTDECRTLETATCKFETHTPELFSVLDDLKVAAQHEFTILLIGETGTGKTTLARLIHELSPCADRRFLTVPCGALPNDLIDSELFGHVKGAFTGADRAKQGKFEAAEGGTILLDEIDVLAPSQQAKLLRVLETGEFEAIGSNDTRRVNARSIVASNVDLRDLVDQQRFRVDLYFRLNQVCFEIPPLRNRPRDIVPMAIFFIQQCCQEHTLAVRSVRPDFLAALKACRWPGNIRQLRNEVRRAVLFCRDGVLSASHLSPEVRSPSFDTTQPTEAVAMPSGLAGEVAHREQIAIEQMLRTQNYNRTATARALGISRVTLYNKIRKYGIRINLTRRSINA